MRDAVDEAMSCDPECLPLGMGASSPTQLIEKLAKLAPQPPVESFASALRRRTKRLEESALDRKRLCEKRLKGATEQEKSYWTYEAGRAAGRVLALRMARAEITKLKKAGYCR